MLRQRIATAVVLVPPLVVALFLLPAPGVVILLGAFVAAGAWEWAALSGLPRAGRAGYCVVVLLAGAAAIGAGLKHPGVLHGVLALALLWWLGTLYELRRPRGGMLGAASGRLAAGLLTLVPAWAALAWLHLADAAPPLLLLFVLLLAVAADTGAYFAGRAFGRTRLAPAISPGKTVEGVIGGAVAVVLLAGFYGTMAFDLQGPALVLWVALAVVSGLVSVLGDLSESKLKRVAGAKDSGSLLPGHGGVLDRIDALSAAAPAFAWGWLILFDARA